jgi:hypothetical protein
MSKGLSRTAYGEMEYSETLIVSTSADQKEQAKAGWDVIDVRATSGTEHTYVTMSLVNAREHIKNVQAAIDFLEG